MKASWLVAALFVAALPQSTSPSAPRRATGAPDDALLLDVAFADARRGLVVGGNGESDPGVVLATADGGETWSARDGAARHRLYDVAFASAEVAVAVGLGGTIVRSADGGATWTRVRESGGWLAGVAFADASRGFAVGHSTGEASLFLRSDDGGATWSDVAGLPAPSARSSFRAIEFRDEKTGVAVADSGLVLVTTDGGGSWSARTAVGGADARLRTLCFVGDATWIGGADGVLLRTRDLAATVESVAIPDTGKLDGLAFASESVGWATTMGGRLLATRDGGASWTPLELGTAVRDGGEMTGLALLPGGAAAIAVGAHGTIVRVDAPSPTRAAGR